MIHNKPTVFISYNQKSGDVIADQIQKRLETIAHVVRDKTSIPDWGSIKAFMKSIRNQDLVVMIITADYLKSSGCMFEVVEAMKDEGWVEHTMFVVADDAVGIYTHLNWPHYLEHWRMEKEALNRAIELVGDNAKSIKLAEELRKVKEIEASLFDFLSCVADVKNPNIKEAVEKIYQRVNKNSSETQQAAEQGDPETLYCLGKSYYIGDGKERDYEKAASYYRQAAELGHIKAQCYLGIMYERGIGVKINGEKAMYWFREAAEQGDACAQYLLGKRILAQSKGSRRENLKAIEWYQKAADQEYIPAQSDLSQMYENGVNVKQDYEKAAYWFQKAYQLTRQSAEHGDSDAQYRLGIMYKNGEIGLEKNEKAAVEWYRKAAMQGHSDAQISLGKIYADGNGVNQDYKEAVKWYEKAGAQGHINALLRLGNIYAKGKGIEANYLNAKKNYKKAEELLEKDADRGNVWAQNYLAYLYQYGKIRETDYDKAIYWYEKAASQGDVHAMQSLCRIYLDKKSNPEMAIKWQQQAVEQGSSSAMTNLGSMYKNGHGVKQDYDMAIVWYQRAASEGNFLAIQFLGEMYERGMGTDSNVKKAVELYTQYAYMGIQYACWRLGYLYEKGLGVALDDGEAVRWYQEAAEHGYSRAQCSLANMYIEGKGVFKDIEMAISWYQRAANGKYGDTNAQLTLGILYLIQNDYNTAFKWFMKAEKRNSDAQAYMGYLYENGLGVKQNVKTALDWYQKSSKYSNLGQFWLGTMYESGKGVPKSDKEAAIWYQKAANSGNSDAQVRLAKLYEKKEDYDKANEWYKKAKKSG